MGKMGEMGNSMWKGLGFLCIGMGCVEKACVEAMLYGRQMLVQEG